MKSNLSEPICSKVPSQQRCDLDGGTEAPLRFAMGQGQLPGCSCLTLAEGEWVIRESSTVRIGVRP